MSKIVIAVPRGRITKECKNLLLKTSFAPDPLLFDKGTRKLTFKSKKRNIEYIKVRAFDACTFVAFLNEPITARQSRLSCLHYLILFVHFKKSSFLK